MEHIHLVGIAGAAMAPVAGMLKERGFHVTGSDTGVYPPASTLLNSLAIPWQEGFRHEHLQPAPDLAVIGNAISRGNPELEYVLDEKIPYCSMPQILERYFIPGRTSIVISGTHGKTTTTAMLAWIFHVAGRKPDFLVGGVAPNFGDRSYGLGGGSEFIIEGDEYDTAFFDKAPKFLHYHPDELVITSLEFDHADIYADLPSIALQFRRLVNLVPRRGRVLIWGESLEVKEVAAEAFCPVETFGLAPDCDWQAGDILWHDSATRFRIVRRGREMARVEIPMAGKHNVLDALAGAALALSRGVEPEALERALASFQSVRRRMEVKGEANGVVVVEDFAHHPTAIRLTLEAARTRWPNRKIWAAIEPRSNTMRRRIFQDVMPDALSLADAVLIGPVNRPQLLPDEDRFSPEALAEALRQRGRTAERFAGSAEIADYLAGRVEPGDLVLIMSNGSFDGLVPKLLERLKAPAGPRR
ncbi:MAG TPA: UDP-N-acetylmuramate:L-alanyl-gamma-D-glutamyl-meso-diaminopimelate ligase [Candidatus Cybelea sp.]|nr:UDP-N-acetylmuramate:L-alanyl-gamma-D-glutamyl-meso-diaminopimelate ligase [Candidatus Cybelea sp.]